MGVLLSAVLIVAGAGIGVWSERRYPQAAIALARRFLLAILYLLVPVVIFFNLASASISSPRALSRASCPSRRRSIPPSRWRWPAAWRWHRRC